MSQEAVGRWNRDVIRLKIFLYRVKSTVCARPSSQNGNSSWVITCALKSTQDCVHSAGTGPFCVPTSEQYKCKFVLRFYSPTDGLTRQIYGSEGPGMSVSCGYVWADRLGRH
jgi:hypothetical protein